MIKRKRPTAPPIEIKRASLREERIYKETFAHKNYANDQEFKRWAKAARRYRNLKFAGR